MDEPAQSDDRYHADDRLRRARRFFRKVSHSTGSNDSGVVTQSTVTSSVSFNTDDVSADVSSCIRTPDPGRQSPDPGQTQTKHTRMKSVSPATSYHQPDFDKFFLNQQQHRLGSIDEGIASFDCDPGLTLTPLSSPQSYVATQWQQASSQDDTTTRLSRGDNVMEQTFMQMLTKHWQNSGGYSGFRRRVANDINHKYCSYCRCDDVIFLFLYCLLGMTYICAGVLGLLHCHVELLINYYLICDGVLSIFVFPVTIMEWTKRVGGCIQDDEKLGRGIFFYFVTICRFAAVTTGTVIMLVRLGDGYTDTEAMCVIVFTLLEVGVALEWAFFVFGLVLPFCLYGLAYAIAKPRTNIEA